MALERVEESSHQRKDKTEGKDIKSQKVVIQVVDKLPTQEVREVEKEGVLYKFVTIEEYLTMQANAGVQ